MEQPAAMSGLISLKARGKRSPFAPDLFDVIHTPTQRRIISVYGGDAAKRAAEALADIAPEIWTGANGAAEITTRLVIAGLWSVGDIRQRIWAERTMTSGS